MCFSLLVNINTIFIYKFYASYAFQIPAEALSRNPEFEIAVRSPYNMTVYVDGCLARGRLNLKLSNRKSPIRRIEPFTGAC